MIEIVNITKHFDDICALDKVTMSFAESQLNVIHGASGSGKSTLIRIIGGIVRPDDGVVVVDDMPIYENPETKKRLTVITDRTRFGMLERAKDRARKYSYCFKDYDKDKARELLSAHGISFTRRMKSLNLSKQVLALLILAVVADTKYLICDDIFKKMDAEDAGAARDMIMQTVSKKGHTAIVALSDLTGFEDKAENIYELLAKGQ